MFDSLRTQKMVSSLDKYMQRDGTGYPVLMLLHGPFERYGR